MYFKNHIFLELFILGVCMFLFKILAIFDMFAGFLLLIRPEFVPLRLLFGHGLYLILKGYIFRGDFLSAIDFILGFYCIFAIMLPIGFLNTIGGLYLFIKGIYSIIS